MSCFGCFVALSFNSFPLAQEKRAVQTAIFDCCVGQSVLATALRGGPVEVLKMNFLTRTGRSLPDHVHSAARALQGSDNELSRREFLATASTFGATTAVAYGLLGLAAPQARAASHVEAGGTVRMQAVIRAMKDPSTFDFNALGNFARGWLEPLIDYNSDGTYTPVLLESWEVSDDASVYTLNVRPGVTWSNGEDFTAADVVFNLTRLADASVEGNSMAARLTALVDADTGKLRAGAVEQVDDMTVKLTLSSPDIAIISNLSDYPAMMVHPSFDAAKMISDPIGTGPYTPTTYDVGQIAVLERAQDHTWWNAGNGAWMDRIEFIDYGEDPAAWAAAAEADEIDHIYTTEGEFVSVFDSLDGWTRNEVATSGTILFRPNQLAEVDGMQPYADANVRRALAMGVNNAVILELGLTGQGIVAENHHIAPVHPEYTEMPAPVYDPEAAVQMMADAGLADFEHDLVSLDTGFLKDSADAVAAQLRDAGIKIKRTVMPSSTFWNDWDKYPFSTTIWNHRPLAVQTYALAYTSGGTWNESGMANAELDGLIAAALSEPNVPARQKLMADAAGIMRDQAVIIQPYWRSLFNHQKENLKGGEIHVSQQIDPKYIYWDS